MLPSHIELVYMNLVVLNGKKRFKKTILKRKPSIEIWLKTKSNVLNIKKGLKRQNESILIEIQNLLQTKQTMSCTMHSIPKIPLKNERKKTKTVYCEWAHRACIKQANKIHVLTHMSHMSVSNEKYLSYAPLWNTWT